jgi:hypothetical protein
MRVGRPDDLPTLALRVGTSAASQDAGSTSRCLVGGVVLMRPVDVAHGVPLRRRSRSR